MSDKHPDFRSYSTQELREVLGFIDRQKFPGRVEEILTILAEREHSRFYEEPSEEQTDRAALPTRVVVDGTSVKDGRAYSLMNGIGSIVFGILWLWALTSLFAKQEEPASLPFRLMFYLAGAGAVLSGFVSLYNAFAKNRFSVYDAVSTENEPDPLSALLDPKDDDERDDGRK